MAARKGLALAEQFDEEFFFREDRHLKSCLYGNTKLLQNVKTHLFKDERLSEVFLLGRRGFKHETFYYEGDELVSIRVEQGNTKQAGPCYTTLLNYQKGQILDVTKFDNGYQEVRYSAKR